MFCIPEHILLVSVIYNSALTSGCDLHDIHLLFYIYLKAVKHCFVSFSHHVGLILSSKSCWISITVCFTWIFKAVHLKIMKHRRVVKYRLRLPIWQPALHPSCLFMYMNILLTISPHLYPDWYNVKSFLCNMHKLDISSNAYHLQWEQIF